MLLHACRLFSCVASLDTHIPWVQVGAKLWALYPPDTPEHRIKTEGESTASEWFNSREGTDLDGAITFVQRPGETVKHPSTLDSSDGQAPLNP